MIRIILVGALGKMGRAVTEAAGDNIIIPVDALGGEGVFADISEVDTEADVIIDFSHHSATEATLDYAMNAKLPAIIACTGHTEQELFAIENYAKSVAVFRSGNMSLGVSVMCALCAKAAASLGDFDIEITETHHRNKLDAPSGTALMLLDEIKSALPYDASTVTDRTGRREVRPKAEIGVLSKRGGSVIGEHEVTFYGAGESLTVKHTAHGRELFAKGALKAAEFMISKPAGLYGMKDLLLDFETADRNV